ncbi:hypothetical protein IV203_026168 [Nitzschia inconspicua]|uniref:Uncharacterized protein n=1 Tax=Nitzschia inconspicua TaxID=303405 RepID=A0A9K3LJG6_9STRA|nr:hypothetical protein IV203_026168 [Nitzschia inconspicua]
MLKSAFIGGTSAVLWVAAEVAASRKSGYLSTDDTDEKTQLSTAISAIFRAGIIFPLASLCFLIRSGACRGFSVTVSATSNQDIWCIFVPSLSLLLIFFLRLVAAQHHFQTYPPGLDFGPKYGLVYTDDGVAIETNVAFAPEFNTWSHCLQGVFAAVLAYVGAISLESGRRWHGVVSLVASGMTVYPIYNFTKRVIKSHETFATSSYSNNGTEWAFGFWGGMALGQCMYFIFLTRKEAATTALNSTLLEGDIPNDTEKSKCAVETLRIVTILRYVVAGALWVAVYGSAVLYGYTWNNCREPEDPDEEECIFDPSDGANIAAIIGLIAVPVFVTATTYCWLRPK